MSQVSKPINPDIELKRHLMFNENNQRWFVYKGGEQTNKNLIGIAFRCPKAQQKGLKKQFGVLFSPPYSGLCQPVKRKRWIDLQNATEWLHANHAELIKDWN